MSETPRTSSGTRQRDSQRKRPVLLSILALILVVVAVVLALTLRSCSSQEEGGGAKPPGGEAEAEELKQFFAKFGGKLPPEMERQLRALAERAK